MNAVLEELVDDQTGIIRLFTPPFADSPVDPGYIKAYPPGVRENGGQYTHAAIWVLLALARQGRGDEAWRCFNLLNPIRHAIDAESAEVYRVEPYVVAADVYGESHYAGRGGWTWYTGSAGWMYRLILESLLGLTRDAAQLRITPVLPAAWPGYHLQYRFGGSLYVIEVQQAPNIENSISLDGRTLAEGYVPLIDDGQEHQVLVRCQPSNNAV